MNTSSTLDRIHAQLVQYRPVGRKLVVIHSVQHFHALKLAHQCGVEVLISTAELTLKLIGQLPQFADDHIILVVDGNDVPVVEVVVATRPDLDIHVFPL